MQTKWATGGQVIEVKESERDGIPVGRVEGYIASFKIETMSFPDKFERGAFTGSIAEHKRRGDRPIRLNFMHNRDPIGGFPIQEVYEDERGLRGVAEINLDRQLGREVYSLAKQGVIRDFSIGFIPHDWTIEDDTRLITRASIMEGSLVDEPMNKDAQVISVKSGDALSFYRATDIAAWTDRDLEAALMNTRQFSRQAAKSLVGRLREIEPDTKADDSLDEGFPIVVPSDFAAALKAFSDSLNEEG